MQSLIDPADIRKLIDGDEIVFRKVYMMYSERVYQFAFSFLKEAAWSEEIVQEVFLKLWLNRKRLDEFGNMWLYLYVIAKRLCLNKLREIRRSTALLDELVHNIEQARNRTEEELFAADMEEYTQRIISSLPRQQQIIYKLSRTERLSHKEIAKQLGLSPNTVKNHMVQALKTLKLSLEQSGHIYFLALTFYCHLVE